MTKAALTEGRGRWLVRIPVSVLSFLLCSSLFAHDFWIEPSTFRPAPRSVLALHLRVGEDFRGEVFRRRSAHIRRFLIIGPQGVQNASGIEGMDPAGRTSITEPGLYTVSYQSMPSSIEIEAEEFEDYLLEEGLERVIELRAERGETQTPGREAYSRCAKSLIWAGEPEGEVVDRGLDCSLELEVDTNPYLLRAEAELPVRLLFRGVALAGALVTAIPKGSPDLRVSARTDAEGRARLKLSRPGIWLLKSVHMVLAPDNQEADWESFWASLTFELPE